MKKKLSQKEIWQVKKDARKILVSIIIFIILLGTFKKIYELWKLAN